MGPNDERILVLAPTGQDAALIGAQLAGAGLTAAVCRSLEELAAGVLEGAAAGLIAEEALDPAGLERLVEALIAQPAWSDLPLIVLTASEQHSWAAAGELLGALANAGNVTLLERPLRVVTLLSTAQAAVRARRRQYEFRDYLRDYERHEEQLRHTQKLESLGILAGGIAHDFNNLLTGILGNASLAAELLPPGHPAQGPLEDLMAASERAAGLTGQMLAYSGKGKFVVGPLDLSAVVEKLTDFFRASIPKRVALRLELGRPPAVEGDESQIEQIIMNLAINAAEAIPEDRTGCVVIRTGAREVRPEAAAGADGAPLAPGIYAFLEVADDGVGMDEETRARIFDPFFTTKFTGRGLGLAAVHGIVRGHRGGLRVESRPGRGTVFTVLLPAGQGRRETGRRPSGETVLVVDDEDVVRRTAAAMLERHGYRVVAADGGRAAIDALRRLDAAIDLVLLDVAMPVMDGEETLRALRAVRPGIKVLVTSGYNEAEALRRFAGHGLAGFIQKPYTAARLAERVRRALDSRPDRASAPRNGSHHEEGLRSLAHRLGERDVG